MYCALEKIERRLKEIHALIGREQSEALDFKFLEGECPGAERPEFDDRQWLRFQEGDWWGGYDRLAWFRAWASIPPRWRGKKLALRFRFGPRRKDGSTAECLLYANGRPLQGIDAWHEQAWLPPEHCQDGRLLVALKAWSGVPKVPERLRFELARLAWIDEAAERYYFLAENVLQSLRLLDENDLRRVQLQAVLEESMRRVDFLVPGSEAFYASLQSAWEFLSEGIARLERPEIKPRVIALGHSHIDMAWLWRLRHTREKAARTFATILHLMRQYPDFRFLHSSPQLYAFLKQDHPDLYERVKEKIAEGAWSINGGMWVEADCNLTGGESLVRQFLFGRRFIREEFGQPGELLWLPDAFGYPASLPQIARKSGMRAFLTTKLSWNQFNRFPYDTFTWRGLDGSELLTHFVTAPAPGAWFFTYNGRLEPSEVKGLWEQYRQKGANDELLLLYGWGDGGGGPTQEMLEAARALRNLPGIPEVRLGTAEEYFERLERRLEGKSLPVWDGELYLELHRGTYTSQAFNKRANRQAEVLYHNAEWLAALASVLPTGYDYPAEALGAGWELILLNQFHDILPGSSIRQVYEDSREHYAEIRRIGEKALEEARASLLRAIACDGESLVVFNPLPWERGGLVEIPWSERLAGKALLLPGGQRSLLQEVRDGGGRSVLLEAEGVPPLGYRAFPLTAYEGEQPAAGGDELLVTPRLLENACYRIRLNERGQIASLFDKRNGREVLAPGRRGNLLQAFEDKPKDFDAWDIDIDYQEKGWEIDDLVETCVEEAGPLRGSLLLRWRFHDSLITQRLTLYRRSARIDFRTEVDWRESQVLLKVAFPVAVRSTRATYEIQFGAVERATHWNTSWDYARFEVAGHRWVDLSEGNYGVSLLNDCKYGHDVRDNVLRLTLIKSAVSPDPAADRGEHRFTYSLLPHAGDWKAQDVLQEAGDLNNPLFCGEIPARQAGRLPQAFRFAGVDAEHVVVETVKKAEQGEAWIVRLYECQQSRAGRVRLRFGLPIARAAECNLVEEEERPAEFQGEALFFPIQPFEIKTFKVWF